MKKRIEWIDIAKFIGIFFVMLSHFESCPSFLRAFFTPFYLAIFFFCSGYVYKNGEDIASFFKKKIRQLFIPWFIYSNLNIILSHIKSFKTHNSSFKTELFRNLLQIRYYDERLWFIPALFTAYLAFYFVIRWYEKKKDVRSLLILCAVLAFLRKIYKEFMDLELLPWKLINLPWHVDYIPTALLFMVLGYLVRHNWEKQFDEKIDRTRRILIIVSYLIVVYPVYFTGTVYPWYIDFFYDNFRHLVALLMIIGIAKQIPGYKLLLYIGSNTLFYFCVHNKAITACEALIRHFLPSLYASLFEKPLLAALFCTVMTIVVALVLLVPCQIVNRYLPWTIGKNSTKKS